MLAAGLLDLFVARYGPGGTLAWAKQSEGAARGLGIAALPDGFLLTGFFESTATFGSGEPGETTLTPASGVDEDIFVARYNGDGSF